LAILISGYTQSIEKKYSVEFDSGRKSEIKIVTIKGKEYVNLDDVYSSLFQDAEYNKSRFLISFNEMQIIFSPNYFIAVKDKKNIQTFQMSESSIFSSANLFVPFHPLLKALESFKIFNVTKNQLSINIKTLKQLSSKSVISREDWKNEVPPNVYLIPPKLNRKVIISNDRDNEKTQLADNTKNALAQQTQKLSGLWFTKSFAEQKNGYIDLHFIANTVIDAYHRPECEGKTVILRIQNANNNITDFSKSEGIYPITKIESAKIRGFLVYTVILSDNLIKCTSRRNGDREIIFSLYPINPKKQEVPKEVKIEKKVEEVKPVTKDETVKDKQIKTDEPVKVEKPIKTEEPVKTEKSVKPDEVQKAEKQSQPIEDKEIEVKKKPDDLTTKPPVLSPSIEKEKKKWELDVIVLDPGHGGNDAGAVGITGVYEKNITLKLALKVRELLREVMPKTKVVLTREDDTFIELYKRGQIANKAEGKLFISIHCNSANKKPSPANGIETYILRPGRNDDAIRVANFENSVIKFEKQTEKYKKLTEEEIIIATMAQSAFVKFSELFARLMQEEVGKATKLEDRGVKQAGFYVLIGASMPNVLFEASFLSNEGDERFVNSEAGQNKIARGIVNAIIKYAEEYGKY